jgi:hypothetical protein
MISRRQNISATLIFDSNFCNNIVIKSQFNILLFQKIFFKQICVWFLLPVPFPLTYNYKLLTIFFNSKKCMVTLALPNIQCWYFAKVDNYTPAPRRGKGVYCLELPYIFVDKIKITTCNDIKKAKYKCNINLWQ